MGETKNKQKTAKAELDQKFSLARPNRQILEDLAVECAKNPSPDNTFQYAFCLSKSNEISELRYSVTILDGLVKEGYEHQVDCMYGAACALYLLGEYEKSRVSPISSCVWFVHFFLTFMIFFLFFRPVASKFCDPYLKIG